jgi:hypothetical protein
LGSKAEASNEAVKTACIPAVHNFRQESLKYIVTDLLKALSYGAKKKRC